MTTEKLLAQLNEIIDYLSLTKGLNWNDIATLQSVAQLLEEVIANESNRTD